MMLHEFVRAFQKQQEAKLAHIQKRINSGLPDRDYMREVGRLEARASQLDEMMEFANEREKEEEDANSPTG